MPDETVEALPRPASRFRWFGNISYGILTLTSHRLIWTPYPMSFDFVPWSVFKQEILAITAGDGPWWPPGAARETVRIATAKGTRSFVIGIIGFARQAENWAYEIKHWANLSA